MLQAGIWQTYSFRRRSEAESMQSRQLRAAEKSGGIFYEIPAKTRKVPDAPGFLLAGLRPPDGAGLSALSRCHAGRHHGRAGRPDRVSSHPGGRSAGGSDSAALCCRGGDRDVGRKRRRRRPFRTGFLADDHDIAQRGYGEDADSGACGGHRENACLFQDRQSLYRHTLRRYRVLVLQPLPYGPAAGLAFLFQRKALRHHFLRPGFRCGVLCAAVHLATVLLRPYGCRKGNRGSRSSRSRHLCVPEPSADPGGPASRAEQRVLV